MGMPATRKPAQVNVKARVIAYIKAQADPASRGKDRSWPAQVDWVWTHL